MPSRRCRQPTAPEYVVMHTSPPTTDGLELMRPCRSYAHRTLPVAASSANSRPSVAPTYTVLPTATGEDSTGPSVLSCQTNRPSSCRSAVIVPSNEVITTFSPAIAGLEALRSCVVRDQIVF